MSNKLQIVEVKGRRYAVVGENEHYFYLTDPWEVETGSMWKVLKIDCEEI